MMTDLEVLKTVRREWTIDKYCAGVFVQDSDRTAIYGGWVQYPDAAHWCVQGYIAKVMGLRRGLELGSSDFYKNVLEPITYEQASLFRERCISFINNHYGHAAVLKIIDEAITQLEKCEQEEYVCEELIGV